MIQYTIKKGVAVLDINMEGYPMNVLNEESIKALGEVLERALSDDAAKGIVITSSRKEFVAGADLKMLQQSADVETTYQMIRQLHNIFRRMETGRKPVVAAINGTALGGGYELALACHRRIALNHEKIQIGLPEIQIGLFPGGGGTQRLPRLIGIEPAMQFILQAKRMNPQEALKAGLVDELADTREELLQKAIDWALANPSALQPYDEIDKKGKVVGKKDYRIPGGNVQSPKGVQTFMAGTALLVQKVHFNYPAAHAVMKCLYEGLQVPIDLGLDIEAKYFAQIAQTKEAKNMIRTLFFAMNEANKGAAAPQGVTPREVKKVGILGAGMMGSGIAYVSAMAGIEVVLKDVSVEKAEKGKDYSRELLKKSVARGKMNREQADQVLALIRPTADAADLAGCDLVIEAVFEDRELKYKVTQEAEAFLDERAVFASNTSTLPITSLAEASRRPEQFIGLHFFSPVDKMMLVEIIMGEKTNDYALATAIAYVQKIRKTPIVVNDSRGFYTSRCFGTYTSEGITMLAEGIVPALIEHAGEQAGMPVGPLEVADAVNLDLIYKVGKQTEKDTGLAFSSLPEGKVIIKFVEELGRTGRRDKKGFYEYPENEPKRLWKGLQELFPPKAEQPPIEELKKRLLYRQALEAARCFEEGVVRTRRDADVGSILAWGFPPYTGGALSFIDYVGIQTFVAELERLAKTYGERFTPTDALREAAAKNDYAGYINRWK
ncbi:3-hydroxyacyl-CoA dehydrogenase/enoyl-CoA hydratase/3-hydroxybutyryl-CoA epimerase [Thermonema lapsum]|uniref:3-hydroxyacyl-CoA dehydrogenase/enoyl-CoA hydratase/3-hydroxybutyryl-CoA epimerase n=1 Tax=Thermonema lapsum TaxID=28195 RepID=A0A846MPX9_9BACT|nr:3-hydroxyacyl-CoA dehydrogenase NAD-binding domain-containing protein [Thermonema lapsum]NIK73519.1 3-hydroxyacyl-CoA dehydrogenase/enoyl-CoA hydratase/3-hydroxybutyryl-CoA epimerase [Thermonema lapsum]